MLEVPDNKNPTQNTIMTAGFKHSDCPALTDTCYRGYNEHCLENSPAFPSAWPSMYLVFRHDDYVKQLRLNSYSAGMSQGYKRKGKGYSDQEVDFKAWYHLQMKHQLPGAPRMDGDGHQLRIYCQAQHSLGLPIALPWTLTCHFWPLPMATKWDPSALGPHAHHPDASSPMLTCPSHSAQRFPDTGHLFLKYKTVYIIYEFEVGTYETITIIYAINHKFMSITSKSFLPPSHNH